jgi:hypothetical protein
MYCHFIPSPEALYQPPLIYTLGTFPLLTLALSFGALYVLDCNVSMDGVRFVNNSANTAGAVHLLRLVGDCLTLGTHRHDSVQSDSFQCGM